MKEPAIKDWICVGCGATITDPQGVGRNLVDSEGNQVGCSFCGSTKRKPDWDWINKNLSPETAQKDSDGDN